MLSFIVSGFLILIMCSLIPVIYYFFQDIKNNNHKYLWKWATAIILLLVAVCLKSMSLWKSSHRNSRTPGLPPSFCFCLSNILLSTKAARFVPFPVHKLNFSILYWVHYIKSTKKSSSKMFGTLPKIVWKKGIPITTGYILEKVWYTENYGVWFQKWAWRRAWQAVVSLWFLLLQQGSEAC